ncbi:hypothetical protein [Geothrix alkalitolerans]|uniref:hypothetical protein n=1 Tax=Geothrix alkalitolerans TaxID=2922724 RepID=UPI001FAF0482|nr:hypothetical protein [Geothrix alkalitolerans]
MTIAVLNGSNPANDAQGCAFLLIVPVLCFFPSAFRNAIRNGYFTMRGGTVYRENDPTAFWLMLFVYAFGILLAALVTVLFGFFSPENFELSVSFAIIFVIAIALALRKPAQKREIQDRWPSMALIGFSLPVLFAHTQLALHSYPPSLLTVFILISAPIAIFLHGLIAIRGQLPRKFKKPPRVSRKRHKSR